jgi:hypothetical protein
VPCRFNQALHNPAPPRVLGQTLKGASLIIAATGDPVTQRRLAARALALGIPALFPALGEGTGGEIFVQLDSSLPCFFCWQGFREEDAGLHGVAALNIDAALAIVGFTAQLALGILDNDSEYAKRLRSAPGVAQPQLFVWIEDMLVPKPVPWREDCPFCPVGPSPLGPEAVEAWNRAEEARTGPTLSPPSPAPVQNSAPTSIGAELARFLLLVLGTLAPIGLILAMATKVDINHPDFGVAIVGFVCVLVFWAGAIAIIINFVIMSWKARGVIIALCIVALIIGGVTLAGK